MEFSAASDAGLVRSHNEDSFALVPLLDGALLAVADGVGGSQAGEVASEIATSTFVALLADGEVDAQKLRLALETANASILERGKERELQGMGTTMTAAFVSDRRLVYAHAGDSRLYLWRAAHLRRVTQDHSVAEELVRRGSLPPEQAQVHPQRHVLTRYLGLQPFSCDEGAEDLEPGDVVLLCTDGLTDALGEEDIEREIERGFDGVARRLVEAANAAGGPDNTTVVAVRVDGQAGGSIQ